MAEVTLRMVVDSGLPLGGQREPGVLADLIVCDEDSLTVPEDEIASIRPVMTVVGGTVVYER